MPRLTPLLPSAVFGVIAALVWVLWPVGLDAPGGLLALVCLAIGIASAQWVILTVEHKGDAFSVALTGAITVIGVVAVGPWPTLLLHLLVGGPAYWYRWRAPLYKTLPMLVAWALETWVIAAVIEALAGTAPDLAGRSAWVGIALGLLAGDAVAYLVVLTAMRAARGPLSMRVLANIGLSALSSLAINVVLAVLASVAVALDPVLGILVGASTWMLWTANRGRHHARQQLASVERLNTFMHDLSGPASTGEVIEAVLAGAGAVTGATRAALYILLDSTATRFVLDERGQLAGEEIVAAEVRDMWLEAQDGTLVGPKDRRPGLPLPLERSGVHLFHAFADGDGLLGVLHLSDRGLDRPEFGPEDLSLTSSLVDHAASSIYGARMFGRLQAGTSRMRRQSRHDGDTGLPNQLGLVETVPDLTDGTAVLLQVRDVDEVVAAFGQGAALELVAAVAGRLASAAAGFSGTVAHVGPARFALVLPGVHDPAEAQSVVRRLRAIVESPQDERALGGRLRVAVGAARSVGTTRTDELLRAATSALVNGARPGGPIAWHNPSLDAEAADRLRLARDLADAIDSDELSVAYQPKLDLRSGRIIGVEALARWVHPERGVVAPSDFIELAERGTLIRQLTLRIAEHAIRATAGWRAVGHEISVAINLSSAVMDDPTLVQSLVRLADIYGLPTSALTAEVTESILMEDIEHGGAVVGLLQQHGMRLSVDDFGTGYSSLAQLKGLPVEEVKIDRSFILNLAQDADDQAIAEAIITMAHRMGLEVVGEGIEDAASLELLRRHGCDLAQGYFIARPMVAAELSRFLLASETGADDARADERGAEVVQLPPASSR